MSEENQPIQLRISDIVRFIRRYFFLFVTVGILSGVGGYLFSYTFQDQYTATALVLPEYYSNSLDTGLGELASLAGLTRRNRTEAVRPDLFPEILLSTPSVIKLLTASVRDQEGRELTLFNYLDSTGTPQPFTEKQLAGRDSVILLTRDQRRLIATLKGCITVAYGKMNGVLSIKVELPDPVLAAGVARVAVDYLTDFVEDYRTGKERRRVELLEEQTARAGERYQRALVTLNTYRDKNRNIFTNTGGMEGQKLELELNRTQSLFNELSQKLELARLQMEENAAVLKILEPPVVPYATSSPRRLIMAASYMMLGCFLALCYALFIREKVHKKFNFA